MKISKSLLAKYNSQDTLLMVSLYPKKGEVYSAGISGVASYAKNIASHMNRRVVVLANVISKPEVYEEGNVLVVRCFSPGSPFLWLSVYRQLKQFFGAKKILIHFDFSIYGSFLASAFILPFLLILKLFGFQVSVVLHHVVVDVYRLAGHLGLGEGIIDRLVALVFTQIFCFFYRLVSLFGDNIIVLEKGLKKKLARIVNRQKIVVIPHVVDDRLKSVSKVEARKKLGISKDNYVVLFFGYINWFKGADIFVNTFAKTEKILGKKAQFILAGGPSPTMAGKKYYQRFYDKVYQGARKAKNITLTGYINQKDIKLYFSSADLVVFPYRDFMCASGVLSLAFSYQKPFIVSENLKEMVDKKALNLVGLQKKDLVFPLNSYSFIKTTKKVLANGLKPKMVKLTQVMREERFLKNNALLYEQALFKPAALLKKSSVLGYTYIYER